MVQEWDRARVAGRTRKAQAAAPTVFSSTPCGDAAFDVDLSLRPQFSSPVVASLRFSRKRERRSAAPAIAQAMIQRTWAESAKAARTAVRVGSGLLADRTISDERSRKLGRGGTYRELIRGIAANAASAEPPISATNAAGSFLFSWFCKAVVPIEIPNTCPSARTKPKKAIA